MPLPELLALTGLGVLTGAYGVIVGAGVGFLLAPLLILVWGLEPGTAVGTSLAVVLVTAVSGSLRYARSRSIDYRSGILFAVAALPGSILGAVAADWAPGRLLTPRPRLQAALSETLFCVEHALSAVESGPSQIIQARIRCCCDERSLRH